ncbi:hypothetical protein [Lactococcus lactis]|nr:hypothetical protein [Lactococcus lactis]NRD16424.1 hypothetical protein [Lactococcus lactis subsp. lactis]
MSENNITNHANIKEITLNEMENVTKRELEAFVLSRTTPFRIKMWF